MVFQFEHVMQQWHETWGKWQPKPFDLVALKRVIGRWQMSRGRSDHGLKGLLRRAGCPPLARGWHSLRHTFASMFIRAGGNLVALQKILGHADIKMTLAYAHLAPDFMGGEIDKLRF